MDDGKIIDMYFQRDEKAINATDEKYGKLLRHISFGILTSREDSEECVNDTYVSAWKSMPPTRPRFLRAFLSKIVRNISLNRYISNRKHTKIFSTETVFDEIAECIPDSTGSLTDDIELRDTVNAFLGTLSSIPRQIFVKRYFYVETVKEISHDTGLTVTNVKVNLMRTREKFKAYLEKAGIRL